VFHSNGRGTLISVTDSQSAVELFQRTYGSVDGLLHVSVPGRVNLIGEHIDYQNLPVLPMALDRRIRIAFRPAESAGIRAVSSLAEGRREFEWTPTLEPSASGDWVNYIKAAAQAVGGEWGAGRGIDAAITSDLPPAAGLSSSSALLTAFTLALLRANGIEATFEELMGVLPEGEYFVGTRGGGMDHAAVLASRPGCALLVHFAPVSVRDVPIPSGWSFLVAHSLTVAEKSSGVREQYNSRRVAGTHAIERLGFASYAAVLDRRSADEVNELADRLEGDEKRAFQHVAGEALRVQAAVRALEGGDADEFGRLLYASHASLRDLLGVSHPALDQLVEAARESGALGARLTGAGFGGCAIVFCKTSNLEAVRDGIVQRYYAGRQEFDREKHLMRAEPSAGALFA
jgi:galactokinase